MPPAANDRAAKQTRERSSNARDAALGRLRHANRWLIAGSVALAGVLTEVAAQAFPGKAHGASAGASTSSGAPTSGHTSTSSSGGSSSSQPQPPEQAPTQASEGESTQSSSESSSQGGS